MRGSSFFENVRQIDIEIGGESGRMPIFYYDCMVMTAVFAARHGALQRLMPDPPVRARAIGAGPRLRYRLWSTATLTSARTTS